MRRKRVMPQKHHAAVDATTAEDKLCGIKPPDLDSGKTAVFQVTVSGSSRTVRRLPNNGLTGFDEPATTDTVMTTSSLSKKRKRMLKPDVHMGRRIINLDPEEVRRLDRMRLNVTEISKRMGVARSTMYRFCRKHDIRLGERSGISEAELDEVLCMMKLDHPSSGAKTMEGHLKDMGLFITRRRLREAWRRVNEKGSDIKAMNENCDEGSAFPEYTIVITTAKTLTDL